MKKILETLRRKWAEYLLEIIVIMIGILGAFMLNNWNISRNELKESKEILIGLIRDLNLDKEYVDNTMRSTETALETVQFIQKEHFDSLDYSRVHGDLTITLPHPNNSVTYNALVNTNKLNLILNDDLRAALVRFYETFYEFMEGNDRYSRIVAYDFTEPYLIQHIPREPDLFDMKKILSDQMTTIHFRNIVDKNISWSQSKLRRLDRILETIESLESQVISELSPYGIWVEVNESILENYVGIYELDTLTTATVTRSHKQLYLQYSDQAKYAIFAKDHQEFFWFDSPVRIRFNQTEGTVKSLSILGTDFERTAERIDIK